MGAPVTGRVTSLAEADRHIRNHHERLVALEERARAAGGRVRIWSGAALQPTTETQDMTRSGGLFIFNVAGTAQLPFDHDMAEKITGVVALVDAAAAGSITMRMRQLSALGAGSDASQTAVSVGTAIEPLELADLALKLDPFTLAPFSLLFDASTSGDRVQTVVIASEPA